MTCRIGIGLVLVFPVMAIAHADLSPTVQEWVDIVLTRSGESWNEAAGMVGNSKGHGTRSTMFYALGLLQRGREEDRERALKAIRSVCRLQYLAPGTSYHGTFSRTDKEPPRVGKGDAFRDHDPNWRDFGDVKPRGGGRTFGALLPRAMGI